MLDKRFNTASGITQLQLGLNMKGTNSFVFVSIPQAVLPSCNSVLGIPLQDWAKMANWKTSPFFSIVASSFGEHEFFFVTFIRFYASIHACFRIHEKSGKPLF